MTIYHLIIRPEQDRLVELVHDIAGELLGTDVRRWSEPEERPVADGNRSIWVSSQEGAELRMCSGTDEGGRPGWLELAGFPNNGTARWVLDEPPRVEMKGLSDEVIDQIWQELRAQQAEALKEWVRTRHRKPAAAPTRGGFKNILHALRPAKKARRIPEDLPHVAQPPFAPDDFPTWLFKGELSSLGRRMPAVGKVIAGVASEINAEERLLIRPFHRMGSQSVVPVAMMRRGHTFVGRNQPTRTFSSIDALLEEVLPALGRYAGADLGKNPVARSKQTSPRAVFISRLDELEHGKKQPFVTSAALQKIPGTELVLRVLEVITDFASAGAEDGLQEIEVSGLPGDVTVYLVGHRMQGQWNTRVFAMGPADQAEDVIGVLDPVLSVPVAPATGV